MKDELKAAFNPNLDIPGYKAQLRKVYEIQRKVLKYQYAILGRENTDQNPINFPTPDLIERLVESREEIQILEELICIEELISLATPKPEEDVLETAKLIYTESIKAFPDNAKTSKDLAQSEALLKKFKTYRYEAALALAVKYHSDWSTRFSDNVIQSIYNNNESAIDRLSLADMNALELMLLRSIKFAVPEPEIQDPLIRNKIDE